MCRYGWWYFRKRIHKKTVSLSLETKDRSLAIAKRNALLRDMTEKQIQQLRGPRTRMPATFGEIIAAYKGKIKTVNEGLEHSSIIKNVSALRTFLRWAHGAEGKKNETLNVDGLSAGILADEILVANFKANYVKAAGEDREARESRRRGADSILRQVKSMFSAQALLIYRDLNLPDLTRFRAAAVIETEARIHLPIQAGTLLEIQTAIDKLKETQPQLWLVHHLQKFLGLRNDEMCQARVEWFKRAPWGQVFFSVLRTPYFEPKRSEGHIPLTAEVAALFLPFVSGKRPDDFLIVAKDVTERHDLVNEVHAKFMRQFLPAKDYAKAGYELRRWAAQVMEERYGHEAAKAFLRHVPQGVAERHYFERWFPWRRLGLDIGITVKDAQGHRDDVALDAWSEGACALTPLAKPAKTPDARTI